jgi:hypothetical protein
MKKIKSYQRIRNKCAAMLIATYVMLHSSLAVAEDFQIVDTVTLSPASGVAPERAQILDAASSSRGGLLLAGTQDASRAWTLHVSSDLRLDWSNLIDQGWPGYGARALADAHDGGYWVVGYGQSVDTRDEVRKSTLAGAWLKIVNAATFDYVSRFDGTGKQLWQRPMFEGAAHRLYCIREAGDGLVVLGHESVTYPDIEDPQRLYKLDAPWVAKLDKVGRLIWQRMLVSDHEPVLTSPLGNFESTCSGLQISNAGQITVAVTVTEIEDAKTVAGQIALPNRYYEHAKAAGTLLVQLDSRGREVRTLRTAGADKAFLFSGPDGFSLVEHMKPAPETPGNASAGLIRMLTQAFSVINASGVRITSLDDNLRKLDVSEIKLSAFSHTLSEVQPATPSGYFIAGCDENSFNSIAWITATGSVKSIQKILPSTRANQCAKIGLAQGATDRDIVVFFSNTLVGNNILRMRTSAP